MKFFLTAIWAFFVNFSFCQVRTFQELLDSGKAEFNKPFEEQDYSKASVYLEECVNLRPTDAEARYFLGYAYSRINSKDGNDMKDMTPSLTIRSSNEFEQAVKLKPNYSGELVILDPYSKLTAEWGALALCYLANNKPDSAVWSFKEGKKRGGFSDFILAYSRASMEACGLNSILISSGDNMTFSLLYLQSVNAYRNDISVVDISLLNTTWYPSFLAAQNRVLFDLPAAVLDTIEYCLWSDSTMSIGKLSWIIQPSYLGKYILRGDRILLSLLKQNNFERKIYFTKGQHPESCLGLENHLSTFILTDQLPEYKKVLYGNDAFTNEITKALLLIRKINRNSKNEMYFVDYIRYEVLNRVILSIYEHEKKQAKKWMKLLEKHCNEKIYPYPENWLVNVFWIKNELNK